MHNFIENLIFLLNLKLDKDEDKEYYFNCLKKILNFFS